MQNKTDVFVSIIVPCYQEEKFIEKCLLSLIKNDYPKDNLEILVFDGGSYDKTREIVRRISERYPFVNLFHNEKRYPPFALNKGIKMSRGEIIIRCDAHARYCRNYIKDSVKWLLKDRKIGNVGGVWINIPANSSLIARAIAYTLSHPFCVGTAYYRIGSKRPREVDTVPFGAWRKEIFNEVGLFDEKFLSAQDLEFNVRLKNAGYKILLDPGLKVFYYPRDSFRKLFRSMFQYAYWKILVNKKFRKLTSLRQLLPPVFLIYAIHASIFGFFYSRILIPLIFYIFLILFFSSGIALRKKDLKLIPFSFLTFVVTHLGYGAGYLKGILDVIFHKEFKRQFTR